MRTVVTMAALGLLCMAVTGNAQRNGSPGPTTADSGETESVSWKTPEPLDETVLRKAGRTIRVAKSGGDFTSIQAAVNSITNDSTWTVVQIYPGNYEENVTCRKRNVCFRGLARRAVTIRYDSKGKVDVWEDGDYPLHILADGCRVENLTLMNNRATWAACTIMVGNKRTKVPNFTTSECDFLSVAKDTVWFWNTGKVQMLNCFVRGYNHVVSIIADQCLLANTVIENTYGSGTGLWAYARVPSTTLSIYNVTQIGGYACLDLGTANKAAYTIHVDGYTALTPQGWFLNVADSTALRGKLYYGRVTALKPVMGPGAGRCQVIPINNPYAQNGTFLGTLTGKVVTGEHFRFPTAEPLKPAVGDAYLSGTMLCIFTEKGWRYNLLE